MPSLSYLIKQAIARNKRKLEAVDIFELRAGETASEGVFARSRAVDGAFVYPSYGNGLVSQLARLGVRRTNSDLAPTTSGVAVSAPANVNLTSDYDGSNVTGLPVVLQPVVTLLDDDVVLDPKTAFAVTVVGATHTVGAGGEVTITAMTATTASVSWKVSYAGVEQLTISTSITVVPDPQPAPAPGAGATLSLGLAPLTSGVLVVLGSVTPVRAGNTKVSLTTAFNITSGAATESANCEVQLAKRLVGANSWELFGPLLVGSEAAVERLYDENLRRNVAVANKGSLVFAETFVLPAGSWQIALFGRLQYGTAISFEQPALVEEL